MSQCDHPYPANTRRSITAVLTLEALIFFFDPLNPYDTLKHHFTSLKTDLIFQQLGGLERKFP